jgi:signal transduction histidine kinase
MGSCVLPPPAGAYRLADLGVARALAWDERAAWALSLEGNEAGWRLRAERVLRSFPPPGGSTTGARAQAALRVGDPRGRAVAALANDTLYIATDAGLSPLGRVPAAGLDPGGPFVCTERFVAGAETGDPAALRLLVRSPAGAWGAGSVTMPGRVTMLEAASDSTLLAGGATADTTGWVALVDRKGVVLATGAHAVPPAHACAMDDWFVVHGEDGNLTVFSPTLESLWDQASRFITPVALLALDYDGDGFEDAALVGERLVVSRKAETDSLRRFLRKPDIMAGARLVERGGIQRYEREETHAEVLLSRVAALGGLSLEREREARDALGEGDDEAALALLSEARAASAAVGDRARVAELTALVREWTSRGRRTLSTVAAAAVLALAGALYAAGRARGLVGTRATIALAAALLAVGALGWRLFGSLPWTPLLALGGLAPLGAAAWRAVGARGAAAPRPGAPIEDLREAVAQLRHAADDDLRAVGRPVTDAPRKNITALAALAVDMHRDLDDREQSAAIVERLRVRNDTFRSVVLPHLDRVVWLSKSARFVVEDAARMFEQGRRIAAALDTVLDRRVSDRAALDAALRTIPEARRELVAAVERAWSDIEANPGCSCLSVFERVAQDKSDQMKSLRVTLERRFEVPSGQDAVRVGPGELYFAVENLFSNALRAVAGSPRRVLRAELASDGVICVLRFSDTGEGMTPTRAREVMDGGADGAGLPGTLRLARRCGGDFGIERTEVGAGTTFVLTIPHWTPAGPGD